MNMKMNNMNINAFLTWKILETNEHEKMNQHYQELQKGITHWKHEHEKQHEH